MHFAPIQAVVAGSPLHAVGWALGAKLDNTGGVALTYFGDGASSQGDIHEAMNFASVMKVPVVFFVQNNGWAILVRPNSRSREAPWPPVPPETRWRPCLLADNTADQAFFDAATADARAEEEQIRAGIMGLDARPGAEMFDFVFQETTPNLQAQARQWREESEHV